MTTNTETHTEDKPTEEEAPAITFAPGSAQWNLLYGHLEKPAERVQPGDAHKPPKGKERLRSVVQNVMRNHLDEPDLWYTRLRPGEIRLLQLQPGEGDQPLMACLFARQLDDVKQRYEALSYCWGNPKERAKYKVTIQDLNASLPDITKEYKVSGVGVVRLAAKIAAQTKDAKFGFAFPIRKNLHDALCKLRKAEEPVVIWVDAICIDQSERGKVEKETQLEKMAEIYNYARNVCIWLGEDFPGASNGVALIKEIMNFQNFDSLLDKPASRTRWHCLIEMMKATWFSRRWIIQEVALSRNATVHCNDEKIHWEDFADAVSLLTEKIEVIRAKFRDEIFEDVETTNACILIQTLTNVCRKSDKGEIVRKLLDLETLVSTLLGFQASYPRDAIYSILSLAKDVPVPGEPWEKLHDSQLARNLLNKEFFKARRNSATKNILAHDKAYQKSGNKIGIHPNYELSSRDLFIAFTTRSIMESGCLDIICRHWVPTVLDKFSQPVKMPSWISPLSRAPYGEPGSSQGRQNGENFVAYTPNDQRKRYNACGSTRKAEICMIDDPTLDPQSSSDIQPQSPNDIRAKFDAATKAHIPDRPFNLPSAPPAADFKGRRSPLSSAKDRGRAGKGQSTEQPKTTAAPEKPSSSHAKMPAIEEVDEISPTRKPDGETNGQPNGEPSVAKEAALEQENPDPPVPPEHEVMEPERFVPLYYAKFPPPKLPPLNTRPIPKVLSRLQGSTPATPSRNTSTKMPDVERDHILSGILAVKGFVLGTISSCSDVMRGSIIPGDWLFKMGWNIEETNNRVPDIIWRLLVADRARRGGKTPQWYKRACLHGLVDSRVADSEGNLHSVITNDRTISELTTRYFNRVSNTVWKRRLIEVDTWPQFQDPSAPAPTSFFGLAPKQAGQGDLVCILFGCTVPVVLKKVKDPRIPDLYTLAGEAYVHGMMDGEAVRDADLVKELECGFYIA